MKPEHWAPHVTVAAIVERDGRFLVIEEHTSDGLRINQPAGHLEAGETLADAVIRETLEETAHPFAPEALVGVYMTHFERPGSAGRHVSALHVLRHDGGRGRRAARSTPASSARCG